MFFADALRLRVAVCFALGATLSVSAVPTLSAQSPQENLQRVNRAIDKVIEDRNLSSEQAAKARAALGKASKEFEIYKALLFAYAADVAQSHEKSTLRDRERGLDDHFLIRLGAEEVRRPNFDPIAIMATFWSASLGKPRVKYELFDYFTGELYERTNWAMYDDSASMHAVNEYMELRRRHKTPDAAYRDAVDVRPERLDIIRDKVLYRWGNQLLTDYNLRDAGKDSRDYLEAHYVHWSRNRAAPALSAFSASDPMAMLSRRIMNGVRADRKSMLIAVEDIIDEAIKAPTVVVADPNVPSFKGLENTPDNKGDARCDGKDLFTYYHGPELDYLLRSVDKYPTTDKSATHPNSYCPRMKTLYFSLFRWTKDFNGAKAAEFWGHKDPDKEIARLTIDRLETLRRTDGDATAYRSLDAHIKRAQAFCAKHPSWPCP